MVTLVVKAAPPALRKETITVDGFASDLVVRALKLSERLSLGRAVTQAAEADQAKSDDRFTARLLALAVSYTDGSPVFTEDEWDIYGADHMAQTNQLVDVAMRLGGFGEAAAKNG